MKKLATLSLDCFSTIESVRLTFLSLARTILEQEEVVLPEGVHIPLELMPFCCENYRSDRFRLVGGEPHLTVFLGPEDERCDIRLADLSYNDLLSVMKSVIEIA